MRAMDTLRGELQTVLERLLDDSKEGGEVALDAVGDAIGAMFVTTDEIDLLLSGLEARGRTVSAPVDAGAESHLRAVVAAARALKSRERVRPTLLAVAEQAGLTREQVLVALALLRVMQR
jgi:hypothetical protein